MHNRTPVNAVNLNSKSIKKKQKTKTKTQQFNPKTHQRVCEQAGIHCG